MGDSGGFTDDYEMDQLSTHGLAEALWDIDNDGVAPSAHSDYQYTAHPSILPDAYTHPSSSFSYHAYNHANNSSRPGDGFNHQFLLAAPPSSSSKPNILSFGYSNQQAAPEVGFGNRLSGSAGHFVVHGGHNFSIPDSSYAAGPSAVVPSAPYANHGGDSSGGVSRAGGGRPATAAQEHIIAERKRREKLSQRFIALSAIVPGLKKTDKASVLGDAIKYMKQLQDRVQTLEEQAAKQMTESAVVVKKSHVPIDGDIASSNDSSDGLLTAVTDRSLPEIEVKVMEQTILLRIQCAHRKAILVKILAEGERLGLSVINSSVMPFTGSVLDITIIAQIEEGFSMPVNDLVRSLHSAITQLM